MHIEGGCHCGYLTYEAEVDLDTARICHCTDCQTLSGTAFRTNVTAPKAGFKLLSGQPKIYVKTAESGNKRAQAFCPQCGTHIYAAAVSDPQTYSIRVGTARKKAGLRPKQHIWFRSALDWVTDLDSIPRFPKGSPG